MAQKGKFSLAGECVTSRGGSQPGDFDAGGNY